jgi:hypothetical protein
MSDKPNILQRLHAAMGEVDYIQKEKKQGMRYSIVSHDAVTAKVRPILVKHGIMYYPVSSLRSQTGNRTEMDLTVRFCNIDDRGDFIDVVATGYGVDDQDKGPGKAISYAVKYALLKALGLETGDDPDLDQDTPHKPESKASYSKQKDLINTLNACKDKAALVSWLGANERDIEEMGDVGGTVMDQYEARVAQFDNGITIPMVHKFKSTEESDTWAAGFVTELAKCTTLIQVNNLCTEKKSYLDALMGQYQGVPNKVHMKKRIDDKRAAIGADDGI